MEREREREKECEIVRAGKGGYTRTHHIYTNYIYINTDVNIHTFETKEKLHAILRSLPRALTVDVDFSLFKRVVVVVFLECKIKM